MKESLIVFLVGLSGCGKSTLCNFAISDISCVKRLIAVTTRPCRANEIDGQDKHFVSDSEFERLRKTNELCLINGVYKYWYAYRKQDFISGDTYIGEMYYKCFLDAKRYHEKTIGIFVEPLSISNVVKGINERGSDIVENDERIDSLTAEKLELDSMWAEGLFDYHFFNTFDLDSRKRFEALLRQIIQEKAICRRNLENRGVVL